jgi:hypothetical protein
MASMDVRFADGEVRHVEHEIRPSFPKLLREALLDRWTGVALGPIYDDDPAAELLSPFVRSARESGVGHDVVPAWVSSKVRSLRSNAIESLPPPDHLIVQDWTRAGLVLEIARRRGFHMFGYGKAHVDWRLKGTVTGRFGVGSDHVGVHVNPQVIGDRGDRTRKHIIPSGPGRAVVVMDFVGFDLSSMISIVPGLRERYGIDRTDRTTDLHSITASLTGLPRNVAKEHLFIHAYGGYSVHRDLIRRSIPEIEVLRSLEPGEAARTVQSTSSVAFRAALSRALPLLVGEQVMPMFTVHDELVSDVDGEAWEDALKVSKALEEGASDRIQVPYTVGVKVGRNYEEAKNR